MAYHELGPLPQSLSADEPKRDPLPLSVMLSVLAGSSLGSFGDACPTANGVRDPHLHFAHGGSADFRGRHNALYNFLSAPGLALNVKTEESTFRLNGGKES